MDDAVVPVTALLYVMNDEMLRELLDKLQNVDEAINFSLSIGDVLGVHLPRERSVGRPDVLRGSSSSIGIKLEQRI